MSGIKNRQFQGIDNAADGIDNPSGQKPSERLQGQGIDNLGEGKDAYPAHGDV